METELEALYGSLATSLAEAVNAALLSLGLRGTATQEEILEALERIAPLRFRPLSRSETPREVRLALRKMRAWRGARLLARGEGEALEGTGHDLYLALELPPKDLLDGWRTHLVVLLEGIPIFTATAETAVRARGGLPA